MANYRVLIYLLGGLWFLRQIKALFFWLYLWQLKEYHLGRLIDHFRTYKGKLIFLNKVFITKCFLLLFFILFLFIRNFVPPVLALTPIFLLLVVYAAESIKVISDFLSKKIIKPVFTAKVLILLCVLFLFEAGFFFVFSKDVLFPPMDLLSFDVLTGFIVSGFVLLFQPVSVLMRGIVIKKAKEKRAKFKDLLVIGITGSYGKTSTKEILARILEKKYSVLKTKAHQNSEVGISQCILKELNEKHQIFIVEMGAYNRGGIKLLCDIAKPNLGILTGINEQHMALFGSLDTTIKTKYELIGSLPQGGMAFLNCNDKNIKTHLPEFPNINICSRDRDSDFWVDNMEIRRYSLSFDIHSKDGDEASFNLNAIGAQTADNVLLASGVAKHLGMSLQEVAEQCSLIKSKQFGISVMKTRSKKNVISSTYSSNPNGVFAHLDYLKLWSGKKAVVMPCLIELGEASGEIHRKIGAKIAKICDMAIVTTKDKVKEIKDGASRSGKADRVIFSENSEFISKQLKEYSGKDDVILLEGRVPRKVIKKIIS